VEAAIDTAGPLIDKNGHQLLVDLPSGAISLSGDPVRLAQVLSNLLSNSAKYTDRGGLIQLTGRVDGACIRLCVKDNGVGISPEHISQLFTMFSQLESTRDRSESGLGIGLALARNIIELHGGTIEARSAGPGAGTEVQVLLPLLEPSPASTPADDNDDSADADDLGGVGSNR
jgi:signal transduction histidine kinase